MVLDDQEVSTILGKSVIPEKHPLYIGLYEGAMGRAEVTQFVEESDCVLLLGTFMTDLNLGIFTAHLDPARCILVGDNLESDIAGAKRLGMTTILTLTGVTQDEKQIPPQFRPDYIINDLTEL